MPKMLLYFACPTCEKVYEVSQQPVPSSGCLLCRACGKPVHQWSGGYAFTGWKAA
jgi:hypothetical protein